MKVLWSSQNKYMYERKKEKKEYTAKPIPDIWIRPQTLIKIQPPTLTILLAKQLAALSIIH